MIYGGSLYYLSTFVYADIFQNNLRRQKLNSRNIDKQEQRDKMIARREGHLKGFLDFFQGGRNEKILVYSGEGEAKRENLMMQERRADDWGKVSE